MRSRARTPWFLLLACALCAPGCPAEDEAPPLPPPTWELDRPVDVGEERPEGEPAPHAVLALVMEDREDLIACSCPDGVVGGYARRASLLAALEEEVGALLAVAGPGSLAPPAESGVPAAEAASRARRLVELHRLVGMDLVALGGADAAVIPAAVLPGVARDASLPLVATNLRCGSGDCPAVQSSVVHETGGGPVVVLSLLDPGGGPLGTFGYEVTDPQDAVTAELARLPSTPAAVVAFCDASPRRLAELAEDLDGVDFLVGTARLDATPGLQTGPGVLRILHDAGSLRVGLLDLVFLGAADASFVDAPRLRDLSEQRLASYGRRARLTLSGAPRTIVRPEDEASADRVLVLGRQLTRGASEHHAFGFERAPVLKIFPQQEAVSEAVRAYVDGR